MTRRAILVQRYESEFTKQVDQVVEGTGDVIQFLAAAYALVFATTVGDKFLPMTQFLDNGYLKKID